MSQENTLLDLDFDGVEALNSVPAGEYTVQISKAEVRTKQDSGNTFVQLTCDIIAAADGSDTTLTKSVTQVYMLPKASDDAKTAQSKRYALKMLIETCGYQHLQGTFDFKNLVGSQLVVSLSEEDDATYGKRNSIKRVIGRPE